MIMFYIYNLCSNVFIACVAPALGHYYFGPFFKIPATQEIYSLATQKIWSNFCYKQNISNHENRIFFFQKIFFLFCPVHKNICSRHLCVFPRKAFQTRPNTLGQFKNIHFIRLSAGNYFLMRRKSVFPLSPERGLICICLYVKKNLHKIAIVRLANRHPPPPLPKSQP